MIGLQELLIPAILIVLVSLFGRKTLKKLFKDFYGVKKDLEDVQKENKTKD